MKDSPKKNRSESYGRTKTPWRILVVDNSEDVADSLAMLLNLMGHTVEVAYHGIAALASAEHFLPDIIFTDISMPDMTGLELAHKLRAIPQCRETPLVALTGWSDTEHCETIRQAGFDMHIVKGTGVEPILGLLDDPQHAKLRRSAGPAIEIK
jgi:CheY-like chemotaxis protein